MYPDTAIYHKHCWGFLQPTCKRNQEEASASRWGLLSLQLRDHQDASIRQRSSQPFCLFIFTRWRRHRLRLIALFLCWRVLQFKRKPKPPPQLTFHTVSPDRSQLHLVLTSWAANGSSRDCTPSSLPAGLSSHPQELMWQHPQTPNSSSPVPCKNLSYLHMLPALRSSSASETFSYSISLQRNMLGQCSLLIFHCRISLWLPEQISTT